MWLTGLAGQPHLRHSEHAPNPSSSFPPLRFATVWQLITSPAQYAQKNLASALNIYFLLKVLGLQHYYKEATSRVFFKEFSCRFIAFLKDHLNEKLRVSSINQTMKYQAKTSRLPWLFTVRKLKKINRIHGFWGSQPKICVLLKFSNVFKGTLMQIWKSPYMFLFI